MDKIKGITDMILELPGDDMGGADDNMMVVQDFFDAVINDSGVSRQLKALAKEAQVAFDAICAGYEDEEAGEDMEEMDEGVGSKKKANPWSLDSRVYRTVKM